MTGLIKVNYESENPTVSARELYEFLGYDKSQWSRWHKKNIEEDGFFTNGVDYAPLDIMSNGNQTKDFQITVEMGKELSMLARTEKGKQARTYFINLEKAWNTPEQVMARALKIANKQIEEAKQVHFQLFAKIEQDKPKVVFADAVAISKCSILVGELAKVLKQNGIEMGQNRLFDWLRNNGYLIRRKCTDYNMPTQRAMELGLFEIKETSICHSDGHTSISKTSKVTGRGQQYFINKFLQ